MDTGTPDLDDDLRLLDELGARNRTVQMRSVLQRVMPLHPDHESVLYYAALVDWLENKDEEALATATRLVENHPGSYDGRLLLFRILDSLGRRGDAESVIIGLLDDYPESALLYARYSLLMLETMHVDKAGTLAARALQLDPDNEIALMASVLHELVVNPGESARQRLGELVRRYPDTMGTALTVVSVLTDEGRDKEALVISQEMLRQEPSSEPLVELVVGLKAAGHWSMIPLRPMQKWGWGASVAIWFGMLLLLRAMRGMGLEDLVYPVVALFIIYIVYSWVWPPLLKRLMRRSSW